MSARSGTGTGRPLLVAALSGVVAGGSLVAVAELLALLFGSSSAPFVAVGGAFIDIIPPWVKDLAISLFGTNDKPVLFASMGLVYALLTALAGVIGRRRPLAGTLLLAALGVFAAVIVLTRAQNSLSDVLPTLVGTVVAVPLLSFLLRRTAPAEGPGTTGTPRRALLGEEIVPLNSFLHY